ncbi:MAG: type II CAAX prenyl endopeptidase Rce1 family protein [Blastocatellia bacterium]
MSMIEPPPTAALCRACGAPLPQSTPSGGFCPHCGAPQAEAETPPDVQLYPPPADQFPLTPVAQPTALDPDHPRWGVWTAIGAWLFSVAALIVAQVAVVMVLYVIDQRRGVFPSPADKEALRNWAMTPHVLTASVYSTILAHLLTILFCWVVVTRLRSQPFLPSLGWNWAGRSPLYWLLIAVGLFVGINLANALFVRILPQKETDFDQLLKSGPQVRIAIAILASFSAPLVEEIVYRGVIFGALRKRFSATVTVVVVTLLFAGVHVPQYFGAWATVAGLILLSLILTVVRARSKTLLPCIVIHFINNAVASLMIVLGKDV